MCVQCNGLLEWLWLDSDSSFDVARMSPSQQLVLNKSLKVDIKVESSAPHWLHVSKNSPGTGSARSLSKLIKAVTFCVRGIRDVFIRSWPAKISTYRSWICKIDSSVAQAPLISVLLLSPRTVQHFHHPLPSNNTDAPPSLLMPQLVSATWFALLLMQQRWLSDCGSGHLSL